MVLPKDVVGPAACCSKANKQSGCWKGKFALFQLLATGGGGWQTSVQRLTPTPNHWQPVGQELLQTEGRGYMQKQQSALTVIFILVTDGLTGLVVLGTVNLQFQGPSFHISLRPVF